jgi:DNA-directed RNA polymerase specialized sigma24 family protein
LPIDPSLLAAVRALPDQQRRVLALRIILDFDTHSTADALGIAPGTVTTHLHRALSALRDELSKEKVS